MTSRAAGWIRRHWKKALCAIVGLLVLVNVLAARHARAFLTYAPAGEPTPQPEVLSATRKVGLLLNGVSIPRPANTTDPSSLGLRSSARSVGSGWNLLR